MAVLTRRRVRFDPFELDRQSDELFKLGHKLTLRGQPIEVLSILLEHPGEVVTREDLCKRLWPQDTFVDFEHSLNTAIKKLRQALDDDVETPRYIETLPKKGYRFIARVETVSNSNEAAVDSAHAPGLIDSIDSPEPPEASSSTGPQSPLKRLWRRTLTAFLLLLALVTATAYWWYLLRRPVVTGIHQLTRSGRPKSTVFFHRPQTDGMRVFFDELVDNRWRTAQVSVKGGDMSFVDVAPLHSTVVAGISDDGSELAVYDRAQVEAGDPYTSFWTVRMPNGPVQRIPGVYNRGMQFVPGWKQLLFSKPPLDPDKLYLVNLDGTGERLVLSLAAAIDDFSVSPDRHIRLLSGGKVWDTRLDGTGTRQISVSYDRWPGWSPDSHTYVYATGSTQNLYSLWAVRELRIFSHLFTSRPAQLTNGPISFTFFTFSRDGKQIFGSGELHRGELSVLKANTGEWSSFLGGLSGAFTDFSHDGQWVTYVSHPDATLWRSRIDGAEKIQLTTSALGPVCNPRWSPDGRLIAFMIIGNLNEAKPKNTLYLIPADGGSPLLLFDPDESASDPSWSPDGKSIVYGGRSALGGGSSGIRIYDLSSKNTVPIANSEHMFSPRWSYDGRYIAALSDDLNRIYLYSFANGRWSELPLPMLPKGTRIGWPAWSHDSKYLFVCTAQNVYRVRVADRKVDIAANLAGLHVTEPLFGSSWFGLTPDDRVLVMQDRGTDEVYALDIEYR